MLWDGIGEDKMDSRSRKRRHMNGPPVQLSQLCKHIFTTYVVVEEIMWGWRQCCLLPDLRCDSSSPRRNLPPATCS